MILETDINLNYGGSDIRKFYAGSKIFLTGGTGFLGHLIIQKLIRNCPELSKIFLLIREKKGKTAQKRIEEIFNDPVFDKMKAEQPNYEEKIQLIHGDCEKADLGLNENDRNLLSEQVSVIFHAAATVRFDEKLKKAAMINVRATRDLVILAKNMYNLKVFVHFSTAYSHCIRNDIDERFYSVPLTGDELLNIVDNLKADDLDYLTTKLIGEWPNTYAYTKAIAEDVIQKYGKGLPICIVRPSMVISTYKDPIDSWINNYYGPVGLAVATGLGLLRAVRLNVNKLADLVPADFVTSSAIAAGWNVGETYNDHKETEKRITFDNFEEQQEDNNIPIFNYISSNEKPLTWKQYSEYSQRYSLKWQTMHTLWYVMVYFHTNHYVVKLMQLLLHLIPAYLVDSVLFIIGKKPQMVKAYTKIHSFEKLIIYFTLREWKFKNNHTQELYKKMNDTDKQIFLFDIKQLNWIKFFEIFGKGLRIYLVKDPLETLPVALARYQKLKVAHYTLVTILYFILLRIVYLLIQMII